MKKIISLIIAVLFIFALAGCGSSDSSSETPSASETSSASNTNGLIGVSLSQENAFNTDFAAALQKAAEAEGYGVLIKYASGKASKQSEDILQLLSEEVKVMVVDAVDIDELESAMDECDSNKIPVFNLLNPINDEVKMLISPDYKEMGNMAGEQAKALLTSDDQVKGHVLMLQGAYDSFQMQMLHDGFKEALPSTEQLTLDAPYCNFDETKAYTAVKKALADAKKPDLIFSQSESMAKGALKAMDEANASVKLITVGADADIIAAVTAKKIHCAIYFSPVELAEKTWLYVFKYLEDNAAKLPQYTSLSLAKADESNAQSLIKEGAKYAFIPGD